MVEKINGPARIRAENKVTRQVMFFDLLEGYWLPVESGNWVHSVEKA